MKTGPSALYILWSTVLTSVLLTQFLPCLSIDASESQNQCPQNCACQKSSTSCLGNVKDGEIERIPSSINLLKFDGTFKCDCGTFNLLKWAERNDVKIEGKCTEPTSLSGQQIYSLARNQLSCGHVRKRRSVNENEGLNVSDTKPLGPDGIPVLPCNFEHNFCQWYQLSDSDFNWKRNQGPTPSDSTGPSGDHTSGNGWYIYIETSSPRKLNDKARLVSPTLRPVKSNDTCKLTLYTHMYGDHIGELNVYQAPVIGHDVVKKSLKTSQQNAWVKIEVLFDSSREFQVILEGVCGTYYRGDIAIDDVTLSPGCQRIEPAYVRLRSQNESEFDRGNVNMYYNGTWGRVCQSGWTGADSDVTCRELGFESANQSSGVAMSGHVMTGFRSLGCSGSEKSVNKCSRSEWSNATSCPTNQTAGLRCTGIQPVCPLKTHMYCPKKGNETAKCISHGQRCDYTNDCWDGSDETNCSQYTRCTFEDSKICGWFQAANDHMDWTRHRGNTPTPGTGPSSDHTGSAAKYYIYMNVAGRSRAEKAKIAAFPRFQGDHEGLCKVRFFYHMYGWRTGALRVLITDQYTTRTVWEKYGSQGIYWIRAEVTLLNTSRSFQVIFEGEHSGASSFGDLAIDDVSFTPECRPAVFENVTCKAGTFKCSSGNCVPLENRCDFQTDCLDGSDEWNCGFDTPGRCNFESNFCDWNNETDDKFDFERKTGRTASFGTGPSFDHTLGYGKRGHYAYTEASLPRAYGDKARLIGPQFMWKNIVGCKLRFFYHMWSLNRKSNVGTLKIMLRNPITRQNQTLWQRTGDQGNQWLKAEVPIATNWSLSQIVMEATLAHSYQSDIAIDDISFSPQCYPPIPSHVDKNYDVRLVGSKSSYQGRVELFRVGYWGTVCNHGWDKLDSDVVCRQLGYAGAHNSFPPFGPGRGQIWLDNLKCFGNESNLNMCDHNGWSKHSCDHSSDASTVCDISGGTTAPVRLADHTNDTHRGRVEVYYHKSWGTICYDEWDLHDAHVICRQAGFLGVERVTTESAGSTNLIWLSKVGCLGNENSINKCTHSGWGSVSSCAFGHAGVVCKRNGASEGDIQLKSGRSPKEGRVEIFHRGEWGTVCEELWSKEDAQVVCYELGFTSVVSHYQSFGPGTGRIWLHNLNCHGNESSLALCDHKPWGSSPCTHSEDVGVICSDNAYMGCYKDNNPRAMSHKKTMKDLTPVRCLRYCQSKGFSYIGLEWSTECYCGNHYNKYGNASENDCASPCVGDPSKKCGGPWRLSVYTTNPAIVPSSAPGYLSVRQSCSSVTYFGQLAYLSTLHTKNYFSGNHTSGYIWSPSYPSTYPNKVHCVWVLNLMPGSKAHIEFLAFDTERNFDYVEVRDGKRRYDKELTPKYGFSGTTQYPLTASSNTMWIKFYADESVADKGFKIRYTASGLSTVSTPSTTYTTTTISPSSLPLVQRVFGGCNGVIFDTSTYGYYDNYHNTGYVRSPGYPGQYPNSQQCFWVIIVQQGYKIKVSVTEMAFASSFDSLTIDDGTNKETSQGRNVPWDLESRDNFMRVTFATNAVGQGKGFLLKYERSVTPTSTENIPTTTATRAPWYTHWPYTSERYNNVTPALPERTTESSGSAEKHGSNSKAHKLSGGSIAGIVIGFLVLICIILILFLLLLKNKKKRNSQGARHFFVNQAYDNTDGMINLDAAAAPGPPGPQDQSIFYASTVVAPPPYTLQAPGSEQVYATPSAPGNSYANLYSQPPPYQQANVTTTGIGSVTNLQAASATDDKPKADVVVLTKTVLPSLIDNAAGRGLPAVEGQTPFLRSLLPPISAPDTKTPVDDDRAGPLPQKTLLSVEPAVNNNQPPAHSDAHGPLEGNVARNQSSMNFDVEVPFEFICPISNDIMKHPVSASDGYTYERRAMKQWFRRHQTSPMTNEQITDLSLRPNEHLQGRIRDFIQAHST